VCTSHVKVGHRQTPYKQNAPPEYGGAFCFCEFNYDQLEAIKMDKGHRPTCC
jgi:hypothetical protein